MDYLVIYDDTGKIYYMASGSVTTPTGLPYLMATIPDGKALISIDVSGETPTPIFEDLPKTETQRLQEQIAELNATIDMLVLASLESEV